MALHARGPFHGSVWWPAFPSRTDGKIWLVHVASAQASDGWVPAQIKIASGRPAGCRLSCERENLFSSQAFTSLSREWPFRCSVTSRRSYVYCTEYFCFSSGFLKNE